MNVLLDIVNKPSMKQICSTIQSFKWLPGHNLWTNLNDITGSQSAGRIWHLNYEWNVLYRNASMYCLNELNSYQYSYIIKTITKNKSNLCYGFHVIIINWSMNAARQNSKNGYELLAYSLTRLVDTSIKTLISNIAWTRNGPCLVLRQHSHLMHTSPSPASRCLTFYRDGNIWYRCSWHEIPLHCAYNEETFYFTQFILTVHWHYQLSVIFITKFL